MLEELQELKKLLSDGKLTDEILDKYNAIFNPTEVTKLEIHGFNADKKYIKNKLQWMRPIKLSHIDRVTAKGNWETLYNVSRKKDLSYHMILSKSKDKRPYVLKNYDAA